MSALERRRHSLASRVWRSLIMMSVILAVVSIFVGLAAHAYALLDQYLSVAHNYASSASALLLSETDIVGLSEDFMATYRSLSDEERSQKGARTYRDRFINDENVYDYYHARSIMRELESNDDIAFLYLGMYDQDTEAIVYIVDPDTAGSLGPGDWSPVSAREIRGFLDWEGEGFPSYIDHSSEYGWIGTGAVPIRNGSGEIVAFVFADIALADVANRLLTYAMQFGAFMLIIINVIALLITRHFQTTLVDPINLIANAAETYVSDRATEGLAENHFAELNIKTGDEIENLSLVMADMERGLAEYEENLKRVTADKQRINTELNLASAIQMSMLPNVFPPFPDRDDFDIYATMNPAKEVGGDFYDFFLIDDDHIALVIGDASGKGIPASLYMMVAKILIDDYAHQGGSPSQILSSVNRVICSNNRSDMFITAWIGILDLRTGTMVASNAGHEYPVVRGASGPFELLKDRHGFVLGGSDDTVYRDYELTLEPGGSILVFTDGVTEASNEHGELFGFDRLLESLNAHPNVSSGDTIDEVLAGIGQFVGTFPQFDDLTMLCLHYRGQRHADSKEDVMAEMTIEATVENIPAVTEFVNEHLGLLECPIKAQKQIDIAIDELLSNIARYAYTPETGPATVRIDVDDDPLAVIITFIDNGVPYDPLTKDDPDITLSAEERAIGGLGIFLVKQTMDDIAYEYKDGQNILRIKKEL